MTKSWVLVTDDEVIVFRVLAPLLEELGFEARRLENFMELPAMLRSDPPAVVILDVERPGSLSGEALGQFIRRHDDGQIPIIVFSSTKDAVRKRVAERVQATADLPKSAGPKALMAAIARATGQRAHRTA